ncbi:MAG: hypothetical protein PHC59_14890 [Thomasclavelia ramosa]|nr:hypothetical protein [Thomasclavelia ramosa]
MDSNMRNILVSMALKYEGDFNKIYDALANKTQFTDNEIIDLKKDIKSSYVTIIDSNYPEALKTMESPPFVLFYEGNIKLLDKFLPTKVFSTSETSRVISTVEPIRKNKEIYLDYFIGCEKQDELKEMVKHMKEKPLPFKDYDTKEKTHER